MTAGASPVVRVAAADIGGGVSYRVVDAVAGAGRGLAAFDGPLLGPLLGKHGVEVPVGALVVGAESPVLRGAPKSGRLRAVLVAVESSGAPLVVFVGAQDAVGESESAFVRFVGSLVEMSLADRCRLLRDSRQLPESTWAADVDAAWAAWCLSGAEEPTPYGPAGVAVAQLLEEHELLEALRRERAALDHSIGLLEAA